MEILISLFVVAFLAATLLPLQSELTLSALLMTTAISPVLLVATASAGNVLGALLNWWLGGRLETYKDKRWFPVTPAALQRAQGIYFKYGRWSLLFSWLPFIGDALTLMAGVMRENKWVFLALVTMAKAGRYIVLALLLPG
ncbi:MAG TPA: YqaA family protein [Micavibrio sp.]